MYWLIYILLTLIISFLLSLFVKNNFLKFFVFFLILSIFTSFWFVEPGSSELAPIMSILILESAVVESNGFLRLMRPLIFSIFLGIIFCIGFYLYKTKKK